MRERMPVAKKSAVIGSEKDSKRVAAASCSGKLRHKKLRKDKVLPVVSDPNARVNIPLSAPIRRLRRLKIGRLNTLDAVAREIKRVYKAMRWSEIEPSTGTKLVFVLRTAAQTMVDANEQHNKTRLADKLAKLGYDVPRDLTLPAPADDDDDPQDREPIDVEPQK